MKAHTSNNKRMRTSDMGYIGSAATGVTDDIVASSHTWQDDVRVIGVQLNVVAEPKDAHSNADTFFHAYCEVCRSGQRSKEGSLLRSGVDFLWNGLFAVGNQLHRQTVMFPEGHGYDFDEGETVNLLGFMTYIGAGGVMPYFYECTLYWVER